MKISKWLRVGSEKKVRIAQAPRYICPLCGQRRKPISTLGKTATVKHGKLEVPTSTLAGKR